MFAYNLCKKEQVVYREHLVTNFSTYFLNCCVNIFIIYRLSSLSLWYITIICTALKTLYEGELVGTGLPVLAHRSLSSYAEGDDSPGMGKERPYTLKAVSMSLTQTLKLGTLRLTPVGGSSSWYSCSALSQLEASGSSCEQVAFRRKLSLERGSRYSPATGQVVRLW